MDFYELTNALEQHLAKEKVFIKNYERIADIQQATEIANELFSDAKISVVDDPLQMGALIIRIDGFDVTVRGETEIKLFQALISKADNFEIYPVGDESIRFSILFKRALVRL